MVSPFPGCPGHRIKPYTINYPKFLVEYPATRLHCILEMKPLASWFDGLAIPDTGIDYETRTQRLLSTSNSKLHNCYTAWNWTFQVRLFIGGAQRVFATVTRAELPKALRYADALLFHFWKYRKRSGKPPIDSKFNFGLESARNDASALAVVLRQLEDYMLEQHILTKPEPKVRPNITFDSARDEMLVHWENFKRSVLVFKALTPVKYNPYFDETNKYTEYLDKMTRSMLSIPKVEKTAESSAEIGAINE